jgi:hypothetical protein
MYCLRQLVHCLSRGKKSVIEAHVVRGKLPRNHKQEMML